jgi:hypothetical protein
MRGFVLLCSVMLLLVPAGAGAQVQQSEKESTEARLKALEEQVRSLQALVESLKAAAEEAKTAPPPPVTAPPPISAGTAPVSAPGEGGSSLPVYGGAPLGAKLLNPDISAIGDVLGSVGKNKIRPVPLLELHEMEVGLQAIIDPYARGDVFISFGETGVGVEEAYMTFTSLPGGFVARAGKMRAAFGQVNTIHNHALPTIERPLVSENLVGGEDGIDDTGISVTRILPAPKGLFLEGTAQVFRGDSADVFTSSRRRDASVVGHLRAFRDLTDSTNLDLGFSYSRGHNDLGDPFITQLYGIDTTYRWKPLRRAIYNSFMFRNEFVWSRREQIANLQQAFGFYSFAEYRVNRRWTVAGRFDRSGRSRNALLTDTGFSTILTYWPSEFSQIRGQYRFTRYAQQGDANELRFQFLYVLGAHGAHPF